MVTQLFEKINTLLANNEIDNALEIAERLIQTHPGEAEGYFVCAEIYSDKQMDDKALEYLEKACFLSPGTVKYLGRFAEKLLKSGKIDEAIIYYGRVLKIEPVVWAYIGLGNAYERKGEIALCIENFQQALLAKDAPETPSADLLARMVKLQKQQGDLSGVIESLHKLVAVVSADAEKYEALCNLAHSYNLTGKYQMAIDNYRLAIEISNDLPKAYIGLADAYHKLEQIDDEISALQKANQIQENFELTQRLVALLQKANTANLDIIKESPPLLDNEKDQLVISDYNNSDLTALINAIIQSGLFNQLFYKQQTGSVLGVADAVRHFLRVGGAQGFKPFPLFEPDAYQWLNPDLPALTNAQCFVHYALKGKAEKRYYNRAILKRDASELRVSPDFDGVWYASLIKDGPEDLNCFEHYLAIGWRQHLPPKREGFDNSFYLDYYKDARESDYPPYLHYLKHKKGRITSQLEANHLVNFLQQSDEFDSTLYRIQCKEPIPEKFTDIFHYICRGVDLKLDPNSNFSTEYYIRKYPDILSSGMVPFIHYLAHGRSEGRANKFDAKKHIHPGQCVFDSNKPTVLVVCHEASRTGAPILGLRLIESLAQRANVISWNGKVGPITVNFTESSIAVINNFFDHTDTVWMIRMLKKLYAPQVAIVNSSVTAGVAVALYEEKVPVVALIHEYGDYSGTEAMQMLRVANKIVFPSESVKASVDVVSIKLSATTRTENISVRHQGRCIPPASDGGVTYKTKDILLKLGVSEDDERPVIILGCGWIQIRKGVEYFIEAARLCKKLLDRPVRFMWVGGGYRPTADLIYSVWLQSQVVNSDLEDEVIFFDETPDLTPFFELADVFFLPSRLDPFPNVAIDAVNAQVPIVAFERGTGFAEFINAHPSVGVAVPFLDVEAAAKAICQYVSGERARPEKNHAITKLFSFADYTDFVWDECQAAIIQQQQIEDESQLLIQSKLMDIDFFKSAHHPYEDAQQAPEYVYTAMWARGLKVAKSRIGFNDKVAQAMLAGQFEKTGAITPLAGLLKSKTTPLTHNTLYIAPDKNGMAWQGGKKVALHIHAYYIENLPSLLHRLGAIGQHIALFITTDKAKKAKEIDSLVGRYSFEATTEVVPNRGRDIGPFIMMMKAHLSAFDIVGHFHLKGTKQMEQAQVRQWQDFLYDSLIGKQGEVASELLAALEAQNKLGLLFQEDPYLPFWGKNLPFAKTLLEDLKIGRVPPENLEYPTGNMFWAKTAALAPLMKRDWQWSDFPAEPVPYDGSILHAIERLSPLICEEAGYEWATVHNPVARRCLG